MNKSKFFLIILGIIVFTALILRLTNKEDDIVANNMVGSDKDEHGCIGSAGYSWCEVKQKCLRVWEEKCEIENVAKKEEGEVIVSNIVSGQLVSSPLTVLGWAKGNWFFEANLPIKIVDENNNIILAHFGTAQGDWMTSEMVPFKSTLDFKPGEAATGYLIISKDNPSGLPENDGSFKVPIRFK